MSSPSSRTLPRSAASKPGDDAQQGGLAAARGTEQGDEFAGGDLEIDAAQDRRGTEGLFGAGNVEKSEIRKPSTAGAHIAMSRSQRFTQSARLSATNFQSTPNMVALVGMPAGTGVSLLVGSEKVTAESLACTSGPIISLM